MSAEEIFDYVVVGAGAAGAAVYNRLSGAASSPRVLLLEAGGKDDRSDFHEVGNFVKLWGSDADWQIKTEKQVSLGGREIVINQGKVLGGSGSINAMMMVRGHPSNFDHWAALGCDGWSYRDVLPYFKKSEDYEGGASELRGTGGVLSVRKCPDEWSRSRPFCDAAVELGFDGPDWDYNGTRQENGAGYLQFHIGKNGKRCSPSDAFLQPIASRSNASVYTKAPATKVLVENGRAVGVEYVRDNEKRVARAEREVVVSAGTLLSPKLLMLSGIGPGEALRSFGIPVVSDLQGVGRNLQDHLQLPVVYRSKREQPVPQILTGNVLFVRTRAEAMRAAAPDLQLNFTPAAPGPLLPVLPNFGGPVMIFLPILVQPYSVGEVRLRSGRHEDLPIVDPKYLDRQSDVDVFLRALELIRRMVGTRAFAELNGGELAPGSEKDLEKFARSNASTLWHPAGTCKMGRDAAAVVDPELRVHGVRGLRVADASVMPRVTSGNTFAPAVMIGEKAADLILRTA